MKLDRLLQGVALTGGEVTALPEVTGVCCDTRTMQPGALFVALTGYKTDGHRYIDRAVQLGAAAVLCERAPREKGPWLVCEDTRSALAVIAANWFGHPGREMTLLAVTGTNGKTTTACLLKQVLEHAGAKVGLIGTNRNMIGQESLPAERTTPEALQLQKLLRQMADAGCTHAVMEVSSHALVLHRTDTLRFTAGIFTNLTADHLDFHRTMQAYRDAKGLLFDQCDLAVLNLDDEAGRYYREHVNCPCFTYSERRDEADLVAKNVRLFADRVEFEALTRRRISRVKLPIPGGFTIYNALGVIACALNLGLELEEICRALEQAQGVRGRIEVVGVKAPYTVLIDYAHTPDALENILTAVRGLSRGRVLCMFGCGGDRDRTKRPVMGAIAGELADVVMLTSDNPRSERPEAIIADIRAGLRGSRARVYVDSDRRRAIRKTLSLGRAGDVILLAGKGHEDYQEVAGRRLHLDEREEIRDFFARA